jgi:hypothetical protein
MTAVSQRAIVDRVRQHAVSGVDHRHPLCPDGPNEITVAIEAGVSKQAVYSHFSDNETLFEATVTAISDQLVEGLSAPEVAGQSLRSRLSRMGVAFLSVMLGPNVGKMAHTLPAALRGNRKLGTRFYNAGPDEPRPPWRR